MSTSTFRQLVAEVAARAKEKLPQAVNGRVESAVKLVLAHDVMPQADGSILVGSSSDPLKTYRLQGTTCECQDFTRGQAPQGFCQHRIAANIARRVRELLPIELPCEPFPDNDPGSVEERPAPALPCPGEPTTPAPQPLPEAAFSLTLKGTLDGVEALLTARGQTAAELKLNLEAIRGLLDPRPQPQAQPLGPQQHNAAAMHRPTTGFCAMHNCAMTLNDKHGRQWWSHRTADGQWCKGR